MVEVGQRDVWRAELPEATGSGPGFRWPVVVVQGNPLNRSRVATVVCVPLTSNLTWAGAPGNTLLSTQSNEVAEGLRCQCISIITIDRVLLTERVGRLAPKHLEQILHGIDVVLGR